MLARPLLVACLLAALTSASCANGEQVGCRCGEPRCARPVCLDTGAGDGGADAASPDDAADPPLDATPTLDVGHDAFVAPDASGCADADGDHYQAISCGGTDCDDARAAVHPTATELCDGVDQDCDGRVDEGSFIASFVNAGGTTWRSYDLDCQSTAAPTAPIQTVFDVESLRRAYFLTSSTYHVLNLDDRTWMGTGARASILPELTDEVIIAALTIPAGHAGGSPTSEGLIAATSTRAFSYAIDLSAPSLLRFTLAPATLPDTNPRSWTPPVGLLTAYLDVTGTWGLDPRPVCPSATAASGPYTAFFSAGQVQVEDDGWCFVPIATLPIASFGPFAYATAPARSSWRHTVYNAGVWVFAAPQLP